MTKRFASFLFVTILLLWTSGAWAQQPGRVPSIAYDTQNNRYLMVWEEDSGNGRTQIMGKFLNPDGSNVGNQTTRLSPDRPNQGCFYQNFDSENGAITTPTNCPANSNPTVAYNNGRYLIAWEVHGTAASPSTSPENNFINIFARIVDASTLNPLPGWEEGILISKAYISANDFKDCGNGKYACSDSEIQAWGQAQNPHVAPRIGTDGFVVTWETNKDFIGCVDKARRGGLAVYGRYIDQNFSATSTTNPAIFAIFKDDSTMTDKCEDLSNVDNATNPRIAYNQTTNDFVIVYEWARANGGNASIGAKRVTLDSNNVGQVDGAMMPGLVAISQGKHLITPSIVSFKNEYVLFAVVSNEIGAKKFSSNAIQGTEPTILNLGNGTLSNPSGASNLGIGGLRPNGAPAGMERLILGYRNGTNVFAVTLDDSLNLTKGPVNISNGIAAQNDYLNFASNFEDFVGVWQGNVGNVLQVFSTFVDSEDGPIPTPTPQATPLPPTIPQLLTPDDNVTFAPIRAYLSWSPSTDPNGGAVTYNVYFGENNIPGAPQVTGLTETNFVIGPETQAQTGITIEENRIYKWQIEAVDVDNDTTKSSIRTINTDNSIVGWWRFDENPNGPVCFGGSVGETVCDYSGNNNHGIPMGSPLWIMPGMLDVLGGAIDFDAVNDFIDIENGTSLNPNSVTVMALVNPNGKVGEQHILDKRGPGAAYNLRIEGVNYPLDVQWIVTIFNGGELFLPVLGIVNNNFRSHLTGTFNLGTGESILYQNGISVGNDNFGIVDRSNKSTLPLEIGEGSEAAATGLKFRGLIDEVVIINRAIPSSEVINNFNSAI